MGRLVAKQTHGRALVPCQPGRSSSTADTRLPRSEGLC